ncbi:hypothetical protein GTY65_39885 [Streptomyces sp. SID8379]|uniref:hypothetical protein n=1 Tax=unclassified Streptomyces TaxID=2593676 RepID=UPI000381F8AB|nr:MULTISPECIES: hypothetical protein [unclassified Streptomyces]MYW70172.1 hypothetical protein [Streptomyces sp. SID8379]
MTGSLVCPGAQWLAHCHPKPGRVHEQWEQDTFTALIPVGIRFDVLRVSQPLGLTLLWELGQDAEKIPVLEDHTPPRPAFCFLTRTGHLTTWPPATDAIVLARGDELAVPSPAADAIDGVQHHNLLWRTAPDGNGHVADPETLHSALVRARDPQRQTARIRAAHSAFWSSRQARGT